MNDQKPYALVTGGSKGIGKCIAAELAARKYNLILVARSENELQDTASEIRNKYGVVVKYFARDLSEKNAANEIYAQVMQLGITVSILVNNAGYGIYGKFSELSFVDHQGMLQVNIFALVQLTHLFIPELKKSPAGYILNIASTASYQAVPYLSLYGASKAFVLSFSRGLRYEERGTNLSVTCVCPGPVNTNFMDRARITGSKAVAAAARVAMEPDAIARTAVVAMFSGKNEVIPGVLNKIGAISSSWLPKNWIEKITASIYH